MAKFTMHKDTQGQWRWRFQADNYRIIAVSSEAYINKGDCRDSIDIVKKEAPPAPVEERP